MNKSSAQLRGFSTYILAAVVFAGTSLSHTETRALGILTNQDPQIVAGGYGAYRVFRSTQLSNEQTAALNREISRIQAGSREQGETAERLLRDAAEVEKGRPMNLNESIYSQGRYGDAGNYMQYGESATALKDSKFRLQVGDAKSIVGSLKDRQDLRKAISFSMEIKLAEGTQNGQMKFGSQTLTAKTLEEITEQLIDRVEAQNPTLSRGSIIDVRFHWTEAGVPDPKAAGQIRLRSEKAAVEQKRLQGLEAESVKEANSKFESTLKGLKRMQLRGAAWVAGAVFIGVIRDGISAEMTTLGLACESEDVMRTQIVTRSIQTGLTEDAVALELQNLCGE